MSEQCNWRTPEGIGWLVCQKQRGHEDGIHVPAGKYSTPNSERVWEEGPRLFEELPPNPDLFLP